MLITEAVKVKWHGFTKQYYIDKGYVFTKIGDEFEVKVCDLPKNSHQKILVECDKCHRQYEREYREYIKGEDSVYGTFCRECCSDKQVAAQIRKHGGCGLQVAETKEKAHKTNLERRGVETPFSDAEVVEKIKITQYKKYGGIGLGSPVTSEKITNSLKERYGVESPTKSETIKQKVRKTMLEKYGVEHYLLLPDKAKEIAVKIANKKRENGNVPISKMEEKVVKILQEIYGEDKCFPSFSEGSLTLDCLLIIGDNKIDVEYDGWYWHLNTEERDRKRNYKLLSLGYKILRIKSKKELPTKEQIIDSVDYLIKGNHHYTTIELDI